MGVIQAAKNIQSRLVGLDRVISKAAAIDSAQVEILQLVGHEVCAHKGKRLRIEIAVVADSALLQTPNHAGARQIISRIQNICIQRDLVVERRVGGGESQR